MGEAVAVGEVVEEVVQELIAVALVGVCGRCSWPVTAVEQPVVVVAAEDPEELPGVAAAAATGPAEETEAGEAGAGVVAGVAQMGAEAVEDVVAGDGDGAETGAAMEVAPEVAAAAASGLSGQLNAGCDAGGCGNRAAAWPLWMPPFSYALSFPQSGYLSSRPQKKWSSPRSGNGHERSLCPPRCQNGLND